MLGMSFHAVIQMFEFVIPHGSEGRADKVLANAFPETSRTLIKRAIENGNVCRKDGSNIEPKTRLLAGETFYVNLTRPAVKQFDPFRFDLDIFYEDEDLLVINKPSGMVVHPGDGTDGRTLVHALLHHCPDQMCPVGAPERPGIVHRLDKETSGLMVVAKKEPAYHNLVKQFSDREVLKRYKALVMGKMKLHAGTFNESIGRHPKVRVKMSVVSNGKPAFTEWRVLESFKQKISLIDCEIKTGRTHQIRVHFSHAGHPIVGDETYGYKSGRHKHKFKNNPERVMLHAEALSFLHPSSGKEITFKAHLPDDMGNLIEELKSGE